MGLGKINGFSIDDVLNNIKHLNLPNTPVGTICEFCEAKKAIVFFIGGAADAEPWLGFIGPSHIMKTVKEEFEKNFGGFSANQCSYHYLGYEHIFKEADIQRNIIDKIDNKKDTAVYLVGHSLGGWNGAHLSQILIDKGYNVDMLITLDPVGTGVFVRMIADIFWDTPTPKASFWANVISQPTNYIIDDLIADFGGQWDVGSKPNLAIDYPSNHGNAYAMLGAPPNNPIVLLLVDRITDFIKR